MVSLRLAMRFWVSFQAALAGLVWGRKTGPLKNYDLKVKKKRDKRIFLWLFYPSVSTFPLG